MTTSRLVGRYEFIRHIGKGGFGVVEEYRDLLTSEDVAIKTIPSRYVNQESKRLIREIDTMSFLQDAHPHVIGFFSMFATLCSGSEDGLQQVNVPSVVPLSLDVEGLEYSHLSVNAALLKHHNELDAEVAKIRSGDEFNLHIVMPLMKGDLFFFIKHGFPSNHRSPLAIAHEFYEEVAVVFAFQICFGLDYLHKCNIVHRDMKPENVLVRLHATNPYESTALIADFGLARDAHPSETYYVCTRYYRPPEIITNVSRGETSVDIWSLGCILFEMVTGSALFTVNSALNERGVWEGHRASSQLEVILNIIGTPNREDIERFMPSGNAQLYLLRSISRPSRLVDLMKNKWRLQTTEDRQNKWIDLISSCLAFFPEQRPSCESLCRHQLFRDCNVFYGENVRQYPTRVYLPTRVGTLATENKQILLNLVRCALQKSSSFGECEENTTDDVEDGVDLCDERLQNEISQNLVQMQSHNQQRGSLNDAISDRSNNRSGNSPIGDVRVLNRQIPFPNLSDSELRLQYSGVEMTEEALDEAVSRLLNDLEYHTHDSARSEQLRELLHYFTSIR